MTSAFATLPSLLAQQTTAVTVLPATSSLQARRLVVEDLRATAVGVGERPSQPWPFTTTTPAGSAETALSPSTTMRIGVRLSRASASPPLRAYEFKSRLRHPAKFIRAQRLFDF
jgi:hypothetical protein